MQLFLVSTPNIMQCFVKIYHQLIIYFSKSTEHVDVMHELHASDFQTDFFRSSTFLRRLAKCHNICKVNLEIFVNNLRTFSTEKQQ